MSDDLIRELAKRLDEVIDENDDYPNPGSLVYTYKIHTALARECLRQMEWARHGFSDIKAFATGGVPLVSTQGQAMDGFTEVASYRAECDRPLTLAPPEWKA